MHFHRQPRYSICYSVNILKLVLIRSTYNNVKMLTFENKKNVVRMYHCGNSIRTIRDYLNGMGVPCSYRGVYKIINSFERDGCINDAHNRRQRMVVTNLHFEEQVLLQVIDTPTISLRRLASIFNTTLSKVYKILKKHNYQSFKFQRHQEMFPADEEARITFCKIMMDNISHKANYLRYTLFTDVCTLILKSRGNQQNGRYWDIENCHRFKINRSQYQIKVNVWVGIVSNKIIGPFFIDMLNKHSYLELLENNVGPALVDAVPDGISVNFQQDGCPAHTAKIVREYLDAVYPNSWIGKGGPINWPARSPDLSPCDFYLWGFLKAKVNEKQPKHITELKETISDTCGNITQTTLSRVRREFFYRIGHCLAVNGQHFEHLI